MFEFCSFGGCWELTFAFDTNFDIKETKIIKFSKYTKAQYLNNFLLILKYVQMRP